MQLKMPLASLRFEKETGVGSLLPTIIGAMDPVIAHLHTYFLFPFAIDREVVLSRHRDVWKGGRWIDGLDQWIEQHAGLNEIARRLGPWQRAPLSRFDADSRAYQDMVFFHPFVRRVFFDTGGISRAPGEQESLLRRYEITIPADSRLTLSAEDERERSAVTEVTSLKLFLFANGIGLLSIGVENTHLPASEALWINEMVRKIFPSSGRQRREGRIPSNLRLNLEHDGETDILVEESFHTCNIRAFQPPLSTLVTSLLYFLEYSMQEFEPVLDERMIVYSYMAIDPNSVDETWAGSEAHEQFISRVLYVDQLGKGYRYDPEFTRKNMKQQIYRRWVHQGTFYGFTSYSNITVAFGETDCDDHQLREGFLIHRMFDSRYYLMMIVALFYRATLLDYAERIALIARRIHNDYADERLTPETLRLANSLRSEFLNFYNYWHFDEIANKDEESEHFNLQCDAFRIRQMLRDTDREVDRMSSFMSEYYQSRNTQAVNRLAMISMILGAGAVLTGFFGMNFGDKFSELFFSADSPDAWVHWVSILGVSLFALGAVGFGIFLVLSNWSDYKDVLKPTNPRDSRMDSLKRVDE